MMESRFLYFVALSLVMALGGMPSSCDAFTLVASTPQRRTLQTTTSTTAAMTADAATTTTTKASSLIISTTTPASCSSSTTTTTTPWTGSTVIEEETKTKEDQSTTIEILKDSDLEDQKDENRDGWEIRLWNDPFNKREFVARCLSTICGKSDTESYQIMMQAHKNGMGVIGRYHFEIAEQYHNSLKENGLTVDMIQVDDE